MKNERNTMTRAEFDATVSTFGADLSRWPETARAAVPGLLVEDAHVRRLLAESEALETVLSSATAFPASRIASLADRIVVEARRTPRIAAVGSRAIAADPTKFPRSAGIRGGTQSSKQAAGLLAASLLLGVFVGQSQLAVGALAAIEDVTGIALDQHATLAQAVGEEWDED